MAIFHCAVSHGSRKDGQSGAAKVDYITRSGKYIGDAGEVIDAWAGHLPSWTGGNPRVLFAAADEYERANARLFTQVLFALPNELSDADALLLAYHYAEAVTENGAPYVLAVHRGGGGVPDGKSAAAEPKEAADDQELPPHNRHAHLVICERVDDGLERTAREWFRRANKKEPALGGAAKDRTMNGGNWVPEARHLCADYINYGLERGGFSERVTCESHETRIARAEAAGDEKTAEQLRLKPPGIHLGPTAWAIEKDRPGRPWRPSWRGNLARVIAAEGERIRGKVEVLNAQLSELDAREAAVTEELEAARRVAAVQFEQREEALLGTSMGEDLLRGARIEVAGETGATLSVVEHGQVVEIAQQRFGAALDLREAGFRKTSVGSRYLIETAQSILGEAQSPTPPQRELIITTAESRLGRELDEREATLRASAAGVEVLGGVQLERADEYGTVLTIVQREQLVDTAERRLRERRKAEQEEVRALDRREETLGSMSTGAHHLAAAARELFGEEKQARTLPDRELMIGEAERRVEEELRGREGALRASVLAGRDVIVTEVEQRLGRELDSREEELVLSACCDELLVEAFSELCASDASFGDGSSLSERSQIIALAERRLEGDRAEDAERSAALDDLEAMLKETSSGAQYLAAAQQEVLGEGKEPATLDERDSVVMTAWRRGEQELDGRAQALAARRCEDGSVEVGGAWLYAIKLTELEAGQQQNDGPSPGCREQALAWAGQQMDRLDALRQEEALDLFFEKLVELEPARGPADIAEEEQRAAAARRQDRVDALSEDELVFVEEKRDALDPQGREVGPWKPAHVAAAVAYAHARVEALDEEIERLRTIIEQTPGDGYARLLAAGFGEASRQQKMEALPVMETDLAEDFDRREERIRTDVEGEEFLRRGRLLVLEADREAATLAERGRVIDQADRLRQEAKREAEAKRQAEQERETRQWEEQRDADVQALKRLSGGMDLFHAHLADFDPKWDSKRNNRSSRENIDAALAAAGSDTARLARLRDVLSKEVDAARYREELGKVAGQFRTSDLDRALAAAEQGREERETRLWEEQKAARVRREARHQMVSDTPGGDERLRAAGWEKARTDSGQERVLTTVERDLTADFDRREKALRTDNQGDEFLRRARLAVLVADREAATLAERGRVIERAEMDREAARRQAERQQEEEAARRREEEAARQREEEAARQQEEVARRREEEAARQQEEEAARRREEEAARQQEEEAARQQEEERQRRELAGREAAVRATSSGSRRLDGERRARFGTAKRSLPVGEELLIAKAVELQITEDLTRRETENAALAGGTALLRAVKKRRGPAGPSDSLAEREEMVVAVEQRLRAGDAGEVLLPTTAPDAEHRPDYLVPAVPDAALDQAVTADDPLFVQDVVFVLRERYAHRAQDAENGYDAAARTASQQRYLGSALASALQWCVLKIRELILKACHKVLGGHGEAGERVQASLAMAGAARQTHQRAAESAAAKVVIDVEAFCEAARADGRDQVAALEEETARRQQVHAAAAAVGVDYKAVYATAEEKAAGSGFDAIAEETERCQEVISYAEAIGFPIQRLDAIWGDAEAKRAGSGYTVVRVECVRTKAREEVLKVLPFEAHDRAHPGARVVAVSSEPSRDLLREVEDDEFVHGILSEVLAESASSAEQRQQAEDFYHQRQTKIEHKKLKKERSGWFSSTPTKEEAKQSVLERFVPPLAARVRKACAVHDLDSLRVRAVEEDRVRRVVEALATALSRGEPHPGSSSQVMVVSDERLNRIVARTGNTFIKDVITTEFLEGLSLDAYGRGQAEGAHLGPRIREKEASGMRREQAEAAVHEDYEVELLRRIEAVCREVQPRPAAEVWRERARAKAASAPPYPALLSRRAQLAAPANERGSR